MKRLLIVLLVTAAAGFSNGCVASRKFVRTEVKTSSDTLNARIETNEGEIKETRDSVDRVGQRVTGVDGRVSDLDSRTTAGMNSIKSDVSAVDGKATQAQTSADRAVTAAERAANDLAALGQQFQNRNQYTLAAEKSVQFRFDSAQLNKAEIAVLDEIAASLMENPNAIVVLEGRTDSQGDSEYNVKLGERRVEAVRRYFAVEKDIPVYRIHEISFGAARPVASNSSRDGREKNRAVTMMVLVPGATETAQGQE